MKLGATFSQPLSVTHLILDLGRTIWIHETESEYKMVSFLPLSCYDFRVSKARIEKKKEVCSTAVKCQLKVVYTSHSKFRLQGRT